jgi:hypothetical protein
MTVSRLIEILQPFAEKFPDAEVCISEDRGFGNSPYELTYVNLNTPGDITHSAFVDLEAK